MPDSDEIIIPCKMCSDDTADCMYCDYIAVKERAKRQEYILQLVYAKLHKDQSNGLLQQIIKVMMEVDNGR